MLEVLEPGLLTTVQDAGRPWAGHLGVPVGGAADRWALAAANAVIGNDEEAAALEMTALGATFRALAECAVGVGGVEMGGLVVETGAAVAAGTGVLLRAGQTLRFEAATSGLRAYLALCGGVDVPEVLGSASTCLVGGFGGVEGRPLRAGDVIQGRRPGPTVTGQWAGPPALLGSELRVVRGPGVERVPTGTFEALVGAVYRVSGHGDRQGIRLEGPPLPDIEAGRLLSQGVVWGAIQLPRDGLPIVLLADHQTVGGYPVPAVVISADRPLLAQLGAGDELRLVEVGLDTARQALVERRRALDAARAATAAAAAEARTAGGGA